MHVVDSMLCFVSVLLLYVVCGVVWCCLLCDVDCAAVCMCLLNVVVSCLLLCINVVAICLVIVVVLLFNYLLCFATSLGHLSL